MTSSVHVSCSVGITSGHERKFSLNRSCSPQDMNMLVVNRCVCIDSYKCALWTSLSVWYELCFVIM